MSRAILLAVILLAGCGIKGEPETPSGRPAPVPGPRAAQADLPTN